MAYQTFKVVDGERLSREKRSHRERTNISALTAILRSRIEYSYHQETLLLKFSDYFDDMMIAASIKYTCYSKIIKHVHLFVMKRNFFTFHWSDLMRETFLSCKRECIHKLWSQPAHMHMSTELNTTGELGFQNRSCYF